MKTVLLGIIASSFAFCAAKAQPQIIITPQGEHGQQWYEDHGYIWRDGQWRLREEREHDRQWYEDHGYIWRDGEWHRRHHRHHGFWRDGEWHPYGE
jgi:hypothetical protein